MQCYIIYIYIYSIYIRAGTKVAKQHSKQKQTNIQRVCKYFYQIALTFIGYTMPPKLDYCFITSTSLVPVAVSTWIQHRWTEKWDRSSLQHRLKFSGTRPHSWLDYTSAHMQNIKVGVAAKLRREKFSFECAANERRLEHSNLLLNPNIYIYTYTQCIIHTLVL